MDSLQSVVQMLRRLSFQADPIKQRLVALGTVPSMVTPPLSSLSPRRAPSDAPPTPFPWVSSAGSIPIRRDQERVPIGSAHNVGIRWATHLPQTPPQMHAMRRALEWVVPWVPLQGIMWAILFDKMKHLFCVLCQSRTRASDCSVTTVRVATVDRRRGCGPGIPLPPLGGHHQGGLRRRDEGERGGGDPVPLLRQRPPPGRLSHRRRHPHRPSPLLHRPPRPTYTPTCGHGDAASTVGKGGRNGSSGGGRRSSTAKAIGLHPPDRPWYFRHPT